jgi:hypothetical protein
MRRDQGQPLRRQRQPASTWSGHGQDLGGKIAARDAADH